MQIFDRNKLLNKNLGYFLTEPSVLHSKIYKKFKKNLKKNLRKKKSFSVILKNYKDPLPLFLDESNFDLLLSLHLNYIS